MTGVLSLRPVRILGRLFFVHIGNFSADIRFISFNNAAQHSAAGLHKLADFVTHAVSSFVSDTNLAFKFLLWVS